MTSHQVQSCEPREDINGVKEVLPKWEKIVILDGCCVYGMILYAHMKMKSNFSKNNTGVLKVLLKYCIQLQQIALSYNLRRSSSSSGEI
jgi:hypothetical protein